MTKRKVLFVLSTYELGGPPSSLLALLQHVDRSRVSVYVAALNPIGPLRSELAKYATLLPVDPLFVSFSLPKTSLPLHLGKLLVKRPSIALAALRELTLHALRGGSVLHSRQRLWKQFGTSLPPLAGRFDVAIAFSSASTTHFIVDCVRADRKYHSVIADSRILGDNIEIQSSYLERMDGALAVSVGTADIFGEMYPFMKPRTQVLYNYLPKSFSSLLPKAAERRSARKPRPARIVTVARLDPLKGFDLAIDACGELTKRGYPIEWRVLGDGPEMLRLVHRVEEAGLEGVFKLLGSVPNPGDELVGGDIFVLPSETEGKSVAIDEAKYLGLPIVATRFETVGEQVVDGLNGLIASFCATDVADKIARLIDDAELSNRISEANRGRADSDKNGNLTEYLLSL